MYKDKNYEYHKQNDYPGERVAERKRVHDRKLAADKKADARVARAHRDGESKADARVARKHREQEQKADARVEKEGRMSDNLIDSEIERSTHRAHKVRRERNAADVAGIVIFSGIIVVLLAGMVWGYTIIQQQNDEINTLKYQQLNGYLVANTGNDGSQITTPVSDQVDQSLVELNKGFLVATTDVKREVFQLANYENNFTNTYQLCTNHMVQSNRINHALNTFAEKQIRYYKRVAELDNKPECNDKIDDMAFLLVRKKYSDEQLFVHNLNYCSQYIHDTFNHTDEQTKRDMHIVNSVVASNKEAFMNSEEAVINCLV
jgi:hypothetical protein